MGREDGWTDKEDSAGSDGDCESVRAVVDEEPLRDTAGSALELDGRGDREGDTVGDDDLERLMILEPEPPAGGKLSAVVEADWLRVGAGSEDSSEGVVGLPLLAGKGDVEVETAVSSCDGESGVPSDMAGDGGSADCVCCRGASLWRNLDNRSLKRSDSDG